MSIGPIIEKFLNELVVAGYTPPIEMKFRAGDYNRLKTNWSIHSIPEGWDAVKFHYSTGTVEITKAKCRECGE